MSETQIDAVMEAPSMKERLAAKKAAARIVGKPDIFEAAASGDLELVEDHVLADAGCIHKTDDCGNTALMCSIRNEANGHPEVARFLVESGANLEAKDGDGRTALMCSMKLEITRFLVESGANLEAKDDTGCTALMLSYLNLECTRFLVESGANLEAKDINGWTAVRFACGNDYLEVTRFLVESGANLEAQDESGSTALMDVCGNLEMTRFVFESGAKNLEVKDRSGCTALHFACRVGNLEVIRFLLESGANLEAKDDADRTVLMHAIDCDKSDVVAYLRSIGAPE